MPTQLRISDEPELQLVARQSLQELGVLVAERLQDRAVEFLVDVEMAETARGRDADAFVAGKRLDRLADGLTERIAAAGRGWFGG